MLTTKNRPGSGLACDRDNDMRRLSGVAGLVLLLALLAGCTPSGPRALREGERLISQGKYPQAIQRLKVANSLLGGTNAQAWNDLGVAYHHAGELAEAEKAYQRALALNHDLSEARFNLGCLWLDQNKLDAAKAEFMAYTLRWQSAPEGFLKLGATQLRAREPAAAEKSFGEALRLSPQNPEALNGLGLARLERGQPREAAQCFESALKQEPAYGPALLNLAVVAEQYLNDRQLALQKYRECLALKPPPANPETLAATVRQLELELNPPPRPVATSTVARASPNTRTSKPVATNVVHMASVTKREPPPSPPKAAPINAARPETATHVKKQAPVIATPPTSRVEVVKVPAEPVLKLAQDVPAGRAPAQVSAAEPPQTASAAPANVAEPAAPERGFFQRINPLNLFRSGPKTPIQPTPLGSATGSAASESVETTAAGTQAVAGAPALPAPGASARYSYRSLAKPAAGNRPEAERLFAQGAAAQQAHRLPEAVRAYRSAVQLDPTFYEAYYNLGLAATEQGKLPLALTAYEDALALRPNSLDARYNFALVLKQANYPADAVKQLERVLVTYPNDARAHLALGNLYAQQMGQPAKARVHYLKVLEVDPQNPEANTIRYWLRDHPP